MNKYYFLFSLQEDGISKLKPQNIQFVPTSSYIMLRVSEFKFTIIKLLIMELTRFNIHTTSLSD